MRPDSTLLLRAAQQVVAEEGFDDALDQTRDRVDQIEGTRHSPNPRFQKILDA